MRRLLRPFRLGVIIKGSLRGLFSSGTRADCGSLGILMTHGCASSSRSSPSSSKRENDSRSDLVVLCLYSGRIGDDKVDSFSWSSSVRSISKQLFQFVCRFRTNSTSIHIPFVVSSFLRTSGGAYEKPIAFVCGKDNSSALSDLNAPVFRHWPVVVE